MTKKIPVTGFNPDRYAGYRIMEIPLSLIDEPRLVTELGLRGYRSPRRVHQYARMLKEGKTPPPIELVKTLSVDGRPLKRPYSICNGGHRYGAAVLAGRETIPAVIAWTEEDGPFNEDEYANEDDDAFQLDDEDEYEMEEPSDEEFYATEDVE